MQPGYDWEGRRVNYQKAMKIISVLISGVLTIGLIAALIEAMISVA
jgi:hypothetical protein